MPGDRTGDRTGDRGGKRTGDRTGDRTGKRTGNRTVAAIALGSNLGDRPKHLRAALVALERTSGVILLRRSTWHETAPVGGPPDQCAYLNGAALLETTLSAKELLRTLLAIEAREGRVRGEANAPRTLDLDLLWFGEDRWDDEELRLPHPRLEERLFVLAPLAELAPGRVLAGCGRTVAERRAELAAAGDGA